MKPDRKLIDEIIANNDAIEAFCNPGPGAPAWTGEGLPPVGVECEAHWSTGLDVWYPVVVVGHDEGSCVFRWKGGERKGGYSSYGRPYFRPLKTPEQLAAEQREREIDTLLYDIICHYGAPKMSEHYIGLATSLYDAGYRKHDN